MSETPARADAPVTSFSYTSDPGDWVAQGSSGAYVPSNATFAVVRCYGTRANAGCFEIDDQVTEGDMVQVLWAMEQALEELDIRANEGAGVSAAVASLNRAAVPA